MHPAAKPAKALEHLLAACALGVAEREAHRAKKGSVITAANKERAVRKQTEGRCPDCGEVVLVEMKKGVPAETPPHDCRSRTCEYPGCRVRELLDEMVQFAGGGWYCPGHGLLLAAKDLVLLYHARGDADWTTMCEIIGEMLPDVVAKAEAQEERKRA